MTGPLKCRLSFNMIQNINERIKNISDNLPSEFNRRLRPITEYGRWKATELRSFGIYYGQFVLKDILPLEYYNHFMQINVALNILVSKKNAAEILLNKFVHNFGILYGKISLIYNVHNILLMIVDDLGRWIRSARFHLKTKRFKVSYINRKQTTAAIKKSSSRNEPVLLKTTNNQ